MYTEEITLTSKDILEKEFKIDTRGYRPQEVDKFLDLIIRDYEIYNKILKNVKSEYRELQEENASLKQEVRNLRTKIETLKETTPGDVNNADLLRRLSNLEKIIYGKED